MTAWDTTVDFVIVGSGGGGMVAALTASAAGAERARAREAGAGRRIDLHVRWRRLGPEQPGHAGRRRTGLLRGRDGPLRGGRRRRRSGVVVRASPRVPHRRPRDDLVPPGPRCRLRPLPRLQRLLLERQGRRRRGSGDRAGSLGRPGARRVAGEAAAGPGPEPRPRGDDERGPIAVQLQPQHRGVHRVGPGRDPHLRRPRPPAGAAHQRRVAHRADARPRARARHPGVDRGPARRPDRRGRPGRRGPDGAQRGPRVGPGPSGRAAGRRRLRPQPSDAGRVRRRPAEPGQVVDRQPRRHRRGAPDGHAARRADRPDGRGVVAARAAHGEVRPIDTGPGPPAAPHDLRRRRRATVRERVELVHGGGQGHVRPRPARAGPCPAG